MAEAAKLLYERIRMPMGLLLLLGLACALGLAILKFGNLAVLGLIGLVAFMFFLREPIWGLYLTTALLLLSGPASTLALLGQTIPVTAAKLTGAATLAAWVTTALVRRKPFSADWKILLILAFLAWSPIGVFLSTTARVQFPEWLRLATLVAFFVMAVHLLDTREKLGRFVRLILLCGFAMALLALAQYALPQLQTGGAEGIADIGAGTAGAFIDVEGVRTGAAVRVSATRGHSNWLALALLVILPLNAYWFATARSRVSKVFAGAMVLAELAALVLTFTRTGLVVGLALVLAVCAKGLVRVNAHRVTAIAAALVVAWFFLPTAYKERVLSITEYSGRESTLARLELQESAWNYMTKHPVFGIGLGGFGIRLLDEPHHTVGRIYKWMVDELGWSPTAMGTHNMYLQVGSETGAVGLLLVLAFFVLTLRDLHRAERTFDKQNDLEGRVLSASVWVSLLTFLLCALFLHALQQKVWWMVAACAVAIPPYARLISAEDVLPSEAADS
jgi:O-antigen ligase